MWMATIAPTMPWLSRTHAMRILLAAAAASAVILLRKIIARPSLRYLLNGSAGDTDEAAPNRIGQACHESAALASADAPLTTLPDTTFVRAKGGLCNKLRVVLSYREAAVVDGGHRLVCVWVINDECPARFDELFEALDGVTFLDSDDPQLEEKLIALGSPQGSTMKRDMRTHPAIAALGAESTEAERWMSEREANMFLMLRPRAALRDRIDATVARCSAHYAAVHVRRTDHVELWGISTPDDEFTHFLDVALTHLAKLPPAPAPNAPAPSPPTPARSATATRAAVYVATDNAATQAHFAAHCGASAVCTLAPIDTHATALRHTSVADAVVDLYVCARAHVFKGSRGSSFSDAIWLLRRATGKAHRADELHTNRQLRRRKWRQNTAAASGEARAAHEAAHRRGAAAQAVRAGGAKAEVAARSTSANGSDGPRGEGKPEGGGGESSNGGGHNHRPSEPAPAITLSSSPSSSSAAAAEADALPTVDVVVAYYRWRSFESFVANVHEAVGAVRHVHVYDKSDDAAPYVPPTPPQPSAPSAPPAAAAAAAAPPPLPSAAPSPSPSAGKAGGSSGGHTTTAAPAPGGASAPRPPPEYTVRRVPNVGRESESYLRHLCAHYDRLAEYTLLIQDDTHVHVPPHHVGAICAQIRETLSAGAAGRLLQVVHRGKKLYPPRKIDAHDKMHGRLHAACQRVGLALPHSYHTHVCAFLLVRRATVHRHPRSFYEALLQWHVAGGSGVGPSSVERRRGASEEELAPWLLEHLWQVIFFEDGQ